MTTIENATAGRATIGYYMMLEYPKTLQCKTLDLLTLPIMH